MRHNWNIFIHYFRGYVDYSNYKCLGKKIELTLILDKKNSDNT